MINRDTIEWMTSKNFLPRMPDSERQKYESSDDDSVAEMVARYYEEDYGEESIKIIEDDLESLTADFPYANSPETIIFDV